MDVKWKLEGDEKVATVAGLEVAVRKKGRTFFSAHYGCDRWVIGLRYRTERTAKAAAVSYALQARTSHAQSPMH
jgi:hypothetical protein